MSYRRRQTSTRLGKKCIHRQRKADFNPAVIKVENNVCIQRFATYMVCFVCRMIGVHIYVESSGRPLDTNNRVRHTLIYIVRHETGKTKVFW